jgi:SpoVK/Ycf46/Vps4 family AAA+-type ATPase
MNKQNRAAKQSKAYKSSTDINNYNQFLQDLDNKQNNNITSDNLQNIDNYTQNLNSMYDKIHKTTTDISKDNFFKYICDPNTYQPKVKNYDVFSCDYNYELVGNILTQLEEEREYYTKKDLLVKKREKVNIQFEINNVNDLLKMMEKYPDDKDIEYNIDMRSLYKIKEPLTDLNNMIGMTNLKENIVDQILFYIQNLHKSTLTNKNSASSNDFMHTVIYGPPGTGKTEIAKIMGSIFSKLGILSKGTFKKVTRSDLVAGYLGQTALKTRDVIKECLGGVLFIDEAYALGNNEKRDSFSKECIDTLCEALSDHKDNLMVIIAGYETDLNDCFFNYNQGLNSRFTWRFKIDDYSASDLHNIFIKKINDSGWSIDPSSINSKWFEKNKASFKFYGRDIETLFAKTKIAHSRRVFCLDENMKKKLTISDIDKGLEIYLKNGSKKDEDNLKRVISYMYS